MDLTTTTFYLLPLIIQGLVMAIDEFYYHHKRGLPRWERIGHPLDTMTVLAVLFYAYNSSYGQHSRTVYICLAVLSSLFIAKDEFVHKDLCSHGEMVLHAFLFILHPLVLVSIFCMWQDGSIVILGKSFTFKIFLTGQLLLISSFLVYQITYWGFFYGQRNRQHNLQRTQ